MSDTPRTDQMSHAEQPCRGHVGQADSLSAEADRPRSGTVGPDVRQCDFGLNTDHRCQRPATWTDRRRKVNTQDFSTDARREAMGIDWMTGAELSQAIPPAYTEFLGRHALAYLANSANHSTSESA